MNSTMHASTEQKAFARDLLEQAGVHGTFEMTALVGGANSKAFRIDVSGSVSSLFFKEYFHHPDDPRDRLGTEFAFTSFAWGHGLRTIAAPLAMNRDGHCALYSYLDGRKLEPHEVTRHAIEKSLQFFESLNTYRSSATHLPTASEACFTLAGHFECLQRRLKRFDTIVVTNELDRQAQEFILRLKPACISQMRVLEHCASLLHLALDAPIHYEDRCLSPSDFGFHNALLGADGVLRFLDFEYAGWDDPAKVVCDFFCQPACPVPMQFYAEFADRIAAATVNPIMSRRRFDLLLPIYRLKWCCIMLNDFLPAGGSRRRFAIHGVDEDARKRQQLQKACAALEQFLDTSSLEIAA